MQEVVNAYLGLGVDVDVFLGNYLVAEPPTFGIRDAELLGRLVGNVRAGNYVAPAARRLDAVDHTGRTIRDWITEKGLPELLYKLA